jgi:hypothetical protein
MAVLLVLFRAPRLRGGLYSEPLERRLEAGVYYGLVLAIVLIILGVLMTFA